MTTFVKSEKGKSILYIVVCIFLLVIAFFYMNSLKTERYAETEVLAFEGMLPTSTHQNFEQEVVAGENFMGVGIQFYCGENVCTDDVTVEIIDPETKNVLGHYERNAETFRDDEREIFLLDEIQKGVAGKKYLVKISVDLGDSKKHVSIGASTKANPWVQDVALVVNSNIYDLKLQITLCEPNLRMTYTAFVCILMLLFFAGGYFLTAKGIAEERILLTILFTIGVAYFVAVPMLQVPDEKGHYYRSYEISQGDFLTPQGDDDSGYSYLPGNLIPETLENLNTIDYKRIQEAKEEIIDTKYMQVYGNPTQALYAPPSYLPQALGCLIGRMISNESVTIFYWGRLVNFLICGWLAYLAVKMIPFGKRLLLLVICMPMYLQQMVSLSSDAFINAMALVLIAYVLNFMQQEGPLKRKQLVVLMILSFLISLCKVVYLPLCFFILLIPSEKLGATVKKGHLYKIVCVTVSALLNLGWLLIGFGYMIEFRPGVDTAAQISFILTHPFRYMGVLFTTIGTKIVDWLGTMVGAKMCILNVYTCLIFVVLYILILVVEMIVQTQEEENFLTKKQGMICIGLFLLIFIITLTSLYAQWTAYQNPQIEGFQGRYFIPILPLLALGMKKRAWNISEKQLLRYDLAMIFAINITTLFCIVTYYM